MQTVELDVKATHTGVHHKLITVAEIERIHGSLGISLRTGDLHNGRGTVGSRCHQQLTSSEAAMHLNPFVYLSV